MKKYKFIITLSDDIEVDSAEEIEGHVSWPNYSQAEPIRYRGVFDTYDEAKEYASKFSLYKYVTSDGYDSFENGDEEYPYFISIFDAEDAVCEFMGIEAGEPICVYPDEYIVEEITEEDFENDIPAGVFKYCLIHDGEPVYDSLEEDGNYFDSYEEALEYAESNMEEFKIRTGEYPSDWLFPIQAENVEIVEFEL